MTDSFRHLPKPLRVLRARPRLFVCAVIGVALGLALPSDWRVVTRALLGWNVGVWLYLAAAGLMIVRSEHHVISRRAAMQDEGRFVILAMAALAATVSIGAIFAQLAIVKELPASQKALHIALASATIIGAWLFIHLTFALHYAHEYFRACAKDTLKTADGRGGILIPGNQAPDYPDFLYFSYVIGVACATADISVTSQTMRRLALVHSVFSFFFNNAVLAMTINIGAGFIGG